MIACAFWSGKNTNCDKKRISDKNKWNQYKNVHMVLNYKGIQESTGLKWRKLQRNNKIFFIQTYEKLCSVIFRTAWSGIIIFL